MKRTISLAAFALAGLLMFAPSSSQAAQPGPHNPAASAAHRAPFPAQPSVAAKGVFGTISASSPAVKQALAATDLATAGKLVGKPGAFVGTVSQVYSPRTHDIAILDFAANYRSALTAVVKPANYSKLPSLQALVGKRVLVTGRFSSFEGRPQIEIASPTQVQIVR